MRVFTFVCSALLCATQLSAQSFTTHPCTDSKDEPGWTHLFGGSERVCETRMTTLPLSGGKLNVRGQNGSIELIGEDRQDIALEAQVSAQAPTRGEAESMVHQISIDIQGTIQAKGPKPSNGHNWSVSYHLRVPHHLAAELNTQNGSLTIADVEGAIQAETTNGSLKLRALAGDVHATTVNGSLSVNLDGSTWRGQGLSAKTTNGGISVSVPQPYSAHLVAHTVNGGTAMSVPNVSRSDIRRNQIDAQLGQGGPTIDFETVNGAVAIR